MLDEAHAGEGMTGTPSHVSLTAKRDASGSSGDWSSVARELDTDRAALPPLVGQAVPGRSGDIQGWDAGSLLQGNCDGLPDLSGMKAPGEPRPLPPAENPGSMEWADPHSRSTSGIFGEGV